MITLLIYSLYAILVILRKLIESHKRLEKMADTIDPVSVSSTWTDINTLSGIASGTEITCQNLGEPQDLLELWTSAIAPDVNARGVIVTQFDQFRVSAGESTVWGRYTVRHGKNTAGKNLLVQIQEA